MIPVVEIPSADMIGRMIGSALAVAQDRSARSQQKRIGASELGFCRNKTALSVKEVQPSDSKSMWAAALGTAVHDYIFTALRPIYRTWLIESEEVVCTFPCGAEVVGHPDLIVREWNAVLDVKTKDGLATVKRYGSSQSDRFQRWTYTQACLQAGILDPSKPVHYGNVYVDRSGKDPDPYVVLEEFDPTLEAEIDNWLTDVIYAVQHGEDANRDVAAPVCERICEFYTACRGGLPVGEQDFIDTPEIRDAVLQYVEAREQEKAVKALKSEAASVLSGVNGIAAGFQVRTTEIPESDVPGYTRAASTRLDVRKVRG